MCARRVRILGTGATRQSTARGSRRADTSGERVGIPIALRDRCDRLSAAKARDFTKLPCRELVHEILVEFQAVDWLQPLAAHFSNVAQAIEPEAGGDHLPSTPWSEPMTSVPGGL